jgi:hypothetical protein
MSGRYVLPLRPTLCERARWCAGGLLLCVLYLAELALDRLRGAR